MNRRGVVRIFFVDIAGGKAYPVCMLDKLAKAGWNIYASHHAEAILTQDLPGALEELEKVLSGISLPIVEIIKGGGGEGQLTQRMRKSLTGNGWKKHSFCVEYTVDGNQRASLSHEVDHVKFFGDYVAALEIEWNNKDPFFDRDLENFQRLHAVGAISVGIIVTRGDSLQQCFVQRLAKFAKKMGWNSAKDIKDYNPTNRQSGEIKSASQKTNFADGWAKKFANDKFAASTTHWKKLMDRVKRGVGSPWPLIYLGIPESVLKG